MSCLITTASLPPGSDPDRRGYPPESGPLPAADVTLGYPSGLHWTAVHYPPGTRWPDEPTEEITPGWWVLGTDHEADPDDGASVLLYVDHAVDADGDVQAEALARALADLLNATTRGESVP